jgi:hypothetical protein
MRELLYPKKQYSQGHPDLAQAHECVRRFGAVGQDANPDQKAKSGRES